MTTLAIIGSGLMGRSLIYTLAKEQKQFEKITVFSSDTITIPCTLNSTAIAASRGVTSGHSPLGDMLIEGFKCFSEHVHGDGAKGVQNIIQYSGATTKLDAFKLRYPQGLMSKKYLKESTYLAFEDAFMIDPSTYINWLLEESKRSSAFSLEIVDDFVVEVEEGREVKINTLNGKRKSFDKVVFTCGSYNSFWRPMVPNSKLETSKPVQGSYYEFQDLNWDEDSFSLTLDGDNIVWNKIFNRLYVGSTSSNSGHYLPPMEELEQIYSRLKNRVILDLPSTDKARVKVGLREKAQKRQPYIVNKENVSFVGGLYKNAFTLSLLMARNFSRQYL